MTSRKKIAIRWKVRFDPFILCVIWNDTLSFSFARSLSLLLSPDRTLCRLNMDCIFLFYYAIRVICLVCLKRSGWRCPNRLKYRYNRDITLMNYSRKILPKEKNDCHCSCEAVMTYLKWSHSCESTHFLCVSYHIEMIRNDNRSEEKKLIYFFISIKSLSIPWIRRNHKLCYRFELKFPDLIQTIFAMSWQFNTITTFE